MSFIDSDPHRPARLNPDDYAKVGGLLGRLHISLAKFDYRPEYGIPHFHDTPFYAARMQEVAAELPDDATKRLATDMLNALAELPDMPMDTPQLIHGDPQTSNILFKDGQPFTFIDFDTVMSASIWIDLGDMLRSLAEDAVEGGGEFPSSMLRAVCDGYRKAAAPDVTADEFYTWSLAALQKIALELGMRFLTDVVDDEYFEYDKSRFASRLESNLHRSGVQWQLYDLCSQERQHHGL
jgi:Ser/Thr protein kinase RdoA (MazF antagonist)